MSRRKALLCIDDEPEVLEGVVLLLGRQYDIHTATSAQQAFQLMESRLFPVVICDIRMPSMDGLECLRRIAVMWPTTVRLILSGARPFGDPPASLEPLAFRYLTKPCEPCLLRLTVAEAFAHHHTLVARDDPRR